MRDTYFLIREAPNQSDRQKKFRIGEVGCLPGLTLDNWDLYSPSHETGLPEPLSDLIHLLDEGKPHPDFPALNFAWEMLFPETYSPGCEDFLSGEMGIPINGLVWMGGKDFQQRQILDLLDRGFTTIKLKIGGLDFSEEIALLEFLFQEGDRRKLTLTVRLDANGSLGSLPNTEEDGKDYRTERALEKLKILAGYPIHSIEQPLPPINFDHENGDGIDRQSYQQMMQESPIPIAWDEELIGIPSSARKQLLDDFRPSYLVLKPGIHGGFIQCEEWIGLAEERGMGWWITSALESSLGLTAIARWTATQVSRSQSIHPTSGNLTHLTCLTQGLGTGGLYNNNFYSPLILKREHLFYDRSQEMKGWDDALKKLKVRG